ncbi:UvrD-helicase domain-containing protein [Streptomyces sp. NPDC054835]
MRSTTPLFTPTDEQAHAAAHFQAGHHMALQAGAGTGKTSTLALLAHSTKRRGRYLAYNRAIAQEAATRFPPTVTCKTAHALAYAGLGHRYSRRLGAPRRPAWRTGQDLGINKPVRIADHTLTPTTVSNAVMRTVTRFCHSADTQLTPHHVPLLRGLDGPEQHEELAALITPFAERAWADLQDPDDGAVRFDPDHFLKLWSLTNPKIPADFLLLDEAQDTNPVVEHIFNNQRDHAQLAMVGDSAQAIYHWRGAKDVMTSFAGTHLTLSQSFRFGPALAHEANRWLTIAEAPLRLTGSTSMPTDLGPLEAPDAMLCRTNVGAIRHVMALLSAGIRVALVGGGDSLRSLALAARQLQDGRPTSHPELVLFPTWGAVQDYAAYDPSGRDLQPLVDLVDTHGTDAILSAVNQLTQEKQAQITVSTAHKAKGREWSRVKIADDFIPPKDTEELDVHGKPIPGPVDPSEARLAYVAVTRARR